MYLLKGTWEEETLRVTTIYNLNYVSVEDITDAANGVTVEDDIVYPSYVVGKGQVLYANASGEYWFEEVEVPLTKEEQLQRQIELQQQMIDDINIIVAELLTRP